MKNLQSIILEKINITTKTNFKKFLEQNSSGKTALSRLLLCFNLSKKILNNDEMNFLIDNSDCNAIEEDNRSPLSQYLSISYSKPFIHQIDERELTKLIKKTNLNIKDSGNDYILTAVICGILTKTEKLTRDQLKYIVQNTDLIDLQKTSSVVVQSVAPYLNTLLEEYKIIAEKDVLQSNLHLKNNVHKEKKLKI